MVLADPGFVVAQVVEPLHQLEVAVYRKSRILTHPMEGTQEYAKFHTVRRRHGSHLI